jgi:hypothetical protein
MAEPEDAAPAPAPATTDAQQPPPAPLTTTPEQQQPQQHEAPFLKRKELAFEPNHAPTAMVRV